MGSGTVIVGGSVAGVGVADELRRLGYADPVIVLESQPELPYDRPPLSKGVLTGADDLDSITFHAREHYESLAIDVRTGTAATGLDMRTRRITLANGSHLDADVVVIATGARARPFPVEPGCGPVWTVREIEDARGLNAALASARSVAMIGGGFIGAEVASSARQLGLDVVVLEAASQPFEALLGSEVATLLAQLHTAAGTRLRCGTAARGVTRHGSGQRIELADGTYEDADVVVAGLGAVPNVEWLARTGLVVGGTVQCDANGRTAAEGIYAAGDVAAWHSLELGAAYRHEHWTSAREQSRVVAHAIAGLEVPPAERDTAPYIWSDQYGKRIQVLGYPVGADNVKIVDHDPERQAWLALYGRAGRLVAVVGCNRAAKTMRYRPKLAHGGVALDDA
jgi:3-phenylpropionate/trans-cinnamate dioxygenase ferredoxin reductase component